MYMQYNRYRLDMYRYASRVHVIDRDHNPSISYSLFITTFHAPIGPIGQGLIHVCHIGLVHEQPVGHNSPHSICPLTDFFRLEIRNSNLVVSIIELSWFPTAPNTFWDCSWSSFLGSNHLLKRLLGALEPLGIVVILWRDGWKLHWHLQTEADDTPTNSHHNWCFK